MQKTKLMSIYLFFLLKCHLSPSPRGRHNLTPFSSGLWSMKFYYARMFLCSFIIINSYQDYLAIIITKHISVFLLFDLTDSRIRIFVIFQFQNNSSRKSCASMPASPHKDYIWISHCPADNRHTNASFPKHPFHCARIKPLLPSR